MQLVAEAHEIPASPTPAAAFAGLAGSSTDHAVPFHCSATGRALLVVELKCPTAVHTPVDEHDTPDNEVAFAALGAGGGWGVQVVPFQLSPKGSCLPAVLMNAPTAIQAVDELHDTPSRVLPPCESSFVPDALGSSSAVQLLPFQDSARGASALLLALVKTPTAMHLVAELQEMLGRDTENPLAPLGETGSSDGDQAVPFQLSAKGAM